MLNIPVYTRVQTPDDADPQFAFLPWSANWTIAAACVREKVHHVFHDRFYFSVPGGALHWHDSCS